MLACCLWIFLRSRSTQLALLSKHKSQWLNMDKNSLVLNHHVYQFSKRRKIASAVKEHMNDIHEKHSSKLTCKTDYVSSVENLPDISVGTVHWEVSSNIETLNQEVLSDNDIPEIELESFSKDQYVNNSKECNSHKTNSSSTIIEDLKICFLKHRLSHSAVNDIVRILKPFHNNLPVDARTLLHTVREVPLLFSALMKKFFTLIEKNSQEIKEMKSLLSSVLTVPTLQQNLPETCPALPVNSIEMLKGFDSYLKDEKKFMEVCTYLRRIGGFNINDTIRRVLSSVLDNDVAKKFNWKGIRGEKQPFSELL